MQYGAIPTSLAERIALLTGAVPIPILDTLFGMLKARVIMAGVRLGVFEALKGRPLTASDLARDLTLDEPALDLLLRALVYCGYLQLDRTRYALSSLGRATMIEGAPRELTGFVQWNYTQWEFAEHLETLVRTGKGVEFHSTLHDVDAWKHYQQAMLEAARFDAPIVARYVPVRKGAARLLDLGGAHGLFGATICRKHPPMHATVLDLPAAVPHARVLAQREGHADLVEHRAGDLLNDELGSGWDVVLLSNILHHCSESAARDVLARVHAALVSSGTVAIWDLERPAPGQKPDAGDGVALFFRLTSTAGAYHGSQYDAWLRDAGFHAVKVIRPRLRPGTVLVRGRRG